MKSVPLWKWLLILFVIAVSALYLYPSYVWYSMDDAIRNDPNVHTPEIQGILDQITELRKEGDESNLDEIERLEGQLQEKREEIYDLRQAAIPLGLDLAGGMHVVLEVSEATGAAPLATGEDEIERQNTLLDQAYTVYRARIDKLGLTEPVIEKQPPNRILIQIPGVKNPADVLNILRATARLEFRLAAPREVFTRTIQAIEREVPSIKDRWTPMYPTIQIAKRSIESVSRALDIASREVPPDYRFVWGPLEQKSESQDEYRNLYLIDYAGNPEMGGDTLERAFVDYQTGLVTKPVVSLEFNKEGARQFARVTTDSVNKNLAIVLDDICYSAPVIEEPIRGGRAVIRGSFSTRDASNLAVVLEAGALKTDVRIVENRSIGPSLGQDSIRQGVAACIYGFIIVIVFMVCYYMISGIFADIALLLNLFCLAAALAMFHGTLTLPGIAGVILTIGMSVDANVIVFDRIREEIYGRKGGHASATIERGYGQALSAILDGNLTTLLTAVVLMSYGTGPIKGFAVTLSVGILISLFTALFVTRVFQDWWNAGKKNDEISIGPVSILQTINIDFLKYGPIFVGFSATLLLAGLVSSVLYWGEMKGIELTGGSMVRLEFEHEIPIKKLRAQLDDDLKLEGYQLQEVGGTSREFIIRTKEGLAIPSDQTVVEVRKGDVAPNQRVSPGVIYTRSDEPEVDLANYITAGLDKLNEGNPVNNKGRETFSASFGGELARKGLFIVFVSWLFILGYIAIRFQFAYGVAAVVALVHDVMVSLGALGIAHHLGYPRELNLSTIAALLTVIGYSVNDTIIVFDRIRENRMGSKGSLYEIINKSINQSLSRTVVTSLTTLMVVFTLYMFGGDVINDFAFVLLVGIGVGTYSSIYVASYLLYYWQGGKQMIRSKA
ncbi:MAG: protein translocase subunit SecD [Candidatus Omnitrophica bacterium]|nr:protein translocase subunit SecD [Candidatus Omnitrophota bacterium]MCB9782535.1 protein translocase subunit SecD [Candidatus Omnitrophota bacterium]